MTNMRPPQKSKLLKVIILGDGGVGKSALLTRFVSNRYEENNFHTIGVEFMNKDIAVDGEKYTLQIWDTAGQERFRALRTPFYRGSDMCLLCYALDDRDSLRGLRLWRNEFLNYADVKADRFPFIVVGNKNDLRPEKRQVSYEDVQQWCTEYGIGAHIETSSKTATNVSDAFVLALRQWRRMECVAEAEQRQLGDTIDLTQPIQLMHRRQCCTGGGGGGGGTRSKADDVVNEADDDGQMADAAMHSPSAMSRHLFGQSRSSPKAPATNYRL
ncbi:ras-related protein Rab-9B [Drosophila virilis]|uniref:ras-related protein Rab-9B n=1 Tax=Drosophila virilis TaxID=7244 RepID=UPI001396505A|nr:ras-related protein Rab-9B [Drosophila virilis]